jgi:hypothetical protein
MPEWFISGSIPEPALTKNCLTMYQYGKFTAQVKVRENPRQLPDHPFVVVISQETPKARYFKVKELERVIFKTVEPAHHYAKCYIQRIADNSTQREQEKSRKKEESKNFSASDFYSAGDYLYTSWGYNQTNVDFYHVVRVLPKSLELIPVHSAIANKEPLGPMSDFVIPSDIVCGDPFIVRVNHNGYCTIGRHSGSKWGGSPCYRSWYA